MARASAKIRRGGFGALRRFIAFFLFWAVIALGLRPNFHRTQTRSDGHLFVAVIAYQTVQAICHRLAGQGEHASRANIRAILEGQQRVTATFLRKDRRTLHVRKATRAEPGQLQIYRALDLDPAPGGVRKIIV